MSSANRSPQLQGIEVRHERGCPNEAVKDKPKCSKCALSFRGSVWDKSSKDGKGGLRRTDWSKNLPQVRRERLDLQSKVTDGLLTDTRSVTFRDYAETWLEGVENGSVLNDDGNPYKASTRRQYVSSLRVHVFPIIGGMRLDKIKRRDLQAMIDRLTGTMAGGSVRGHLSPVRAIFRYAAQRDAVIVNPTLNLSLPAAGKRKVVRESTGEQGEMVIRKARDVVALIERLPETDRAPFATAALAGLRRGELRALRVGHIDFEAGIIRVRLNRDASEGDTTLKSDSGRREVPIIDALRPYLVEQVASLGLGAKADDFVLPNRRGGPLDADRYLERCRNYWAGRRWDNKAQEWMTFADPMHPLGLHDARHTFASLLIASKANLKQISRMMGHSSIKITLDRYGHLLPGSEAEAAAVMNAYLATELA